MKIIFVLDDQSVLVTTPEELQLCQVEPSLSALVLPVGKNEEGEDLFRPLITYPVVLMVPPPAAPVPESAPAGEAVAVPIQKPEQLVKKGKKKA